MRSTAEKELRAWLTSPYAKDVRLADEEIDKLVAELVARQFPSPPKAVDRIARKLFPNRFEENNMSTNRVVPSLEKRAAPQQSVEDIVQVVKKYEQSGHWQSCASQFESPARSKANFALLANAIKDFRATGQHLRVDHVAEIVMRLASAGVFEKVPTVQVVEAPKPVEVAPEPDARELHNRQVRMERDLQNRDTHPVRGAREKAQPLLKPVTNTNVAEAAASEKAARENEIINTAISRIDSFAGASHSRTYSGRAHLRSVFQAAMDAGQPAEAVLAAVEAEANKLVDSGSIR